MSGLPEVKKNSKYSKKWNDNDMKSNVHSIHILENKIKTEEKH